MVTQKPLSNRPLYSNGVIDTLAVDEWAVTFGTARRGLGGQRPRPDPPRCAICRPIAAHPLTASVLTSYYSMWYCNYLG